MVGGFVLGMGGLHWGEMEVGGGGVIVLGAVLGSDNRLGRLEWEWKGGHSWGLHEVEQGMQQRLTGRCRWAPPAPGRPQHCWRVSHGWRGHSCDEWGGHACDDSEQPELPRGPATTSAAQGACRARAGGGHPEHPQHHPLPPPQRPRERPRGQPSTPNLDAASRGGSGGVSYVCNAYNAVCAERVHCIPCACSSVCG